MNLWEMIVAVVVIVTIGSVIRAKFGIGSDERGNDVNLRGDATAAENQRLREDIRSLKDRIAVLERVITDTNTSSNLDREIEKLRHQDR